MNREAQKLAVFLRDARARISPGSVGLPVGRRRVAGLRSEEVAELIGVSATWYARCEGGAAQLSIATLDRLAAVLRLSGAERATFISLARRDVVAGPSRCDPLLGYEQPSSATDHLRAELLSGQFFEEADVAVSPSREFRRLNGALGTRSYHAIAIRSDARDWRYALGCALTEARPATDLERSIVATVGSIAELCARTVA
jgi:transcriptional regulator with XRE-family HTH domain